MTHFPRAAALAAATLLLAGPAAADQVFNDDVIIDGSLCVGLDCVNGENFGFDAIRLKENNLRLHFDDTSSSASFPKNDWRIIINDSSNGGAEYFSIHDATATKTPLKIEAGAPNDALRIRNNGRIGFGTSTPVVNLHVAEGNTPTLRLEQNGSAGFTTQTWDVAGNEAGFFVRDVTGGSKLSLRIRPGAPASSIDVAGDGDTGIGTDSPGAQLHVRTTRASNIIPVIRIDEANTAKAVREMMHMTNNGGSFVTMNNRDTGESWYMVHENNAPNRFFLSHSNGGASEFALDQSGNVTITGSITTGGGTCGSGCDAVFTEEYDLPSIAEHNARMWAAGYLPNVGPTLENAPINLSDKVGRMLNELEHAHIYIGQLHERIEALEAQVVAAAE